MSHTEQKVFFRWRLVEPLGLEELRARLGDIGDVLDGARPSLGDRGCDVEYIWEFRSQRPLIAVEDALFKALSTVAAIWIRCRSGFRYDSPLADSDVDGINQVDHHCDRIRTDEWRPCRYGFDEIRIQGATSRVPQFEIDIEVQRWRGVGSYLTRNCSAALFARYDPAPGPELTRAEPIDALALLGDAPFSRIDWFWRGRVVHSVIAGESGPDGSPYRAAQRDVMHVCADGWDNCLDDVYLERTGDPGLRRPAAVYQADRFEYVPDDDDD